MSNRIIVRRIVQLNIFNNNDIYIIYKYIYIYNNEMKWTNKIIKYSKRTVHIFFFLLMASVLIIDGNNEWMNEWMNLNCVSLIRHPNIWRQPIWYMHFIAASILSFIARSCCGVKSMIVFHFLPLCSLGTFFSTMLGQTTVQPVSQSTIHLPLVLLLLLLVCHYCSSSSFYIALADDDDDRELVIWKCQLTLGLSQCQWLFSNWCSDQ